MKTLKIISIALVGLIVVCLSFLMWYSMHYSMDVIQPFEVNSPELSSRVLIASQGSEFKDEVVRELVAGLKSDSVYIRVIDVSQLSEINETEWSAIAILHTWENWKPQPDAKQFVENSKAPGKLVLLSTSGSGVDKMSGIDAISSASIKDQAPDLAHKMILRIKKILDSGS